MAMKLICINMNSMFNERLWTKFISLALEQRSTKTKLQIKFVAQNTKANKKRIVERIAKTR